MKLHYIYDPLCGWCYGASALVHVAATLTEVVLHGGGMMTGAQRQQVTPQLRQFVLSHDQLIANASGQPFGRAYQDGLLNDRSAVFDSAPPTAAILVAQQQAGQGLAMLAAVQQAHYVDGRQINQTDVLTDLALKIGLDAASFRAALAVQLHSPQGDTGQSPVAQHIRQTRHLMALSGAQGFPTLLLQQGQTLQRLEFSQFIGRPEAFAVWLRDVLQLSQQAALDQAMLSEAAPSKAERTKVADAPAQCSVQGCELG